MRLVNCRTALVLISILLGLMPAVSHAKERIALVIGNADYEQEPLLNPVNDAQDIANKLKSIGFQVTLLKNASKREMMTSIDSLKDELYGSDKVGLVYFAGHGVEVDGVNYLIPVGIRVLNEDDVRFEGVPANYALAVLGRAKNKLNMVILDACRNNPYKNSFRSSVRGLNRMSVPSQDIKVIYAAQPGKIAFDGNGRNGIFTKHFLKALDKPGLKVNEVFQETARGVLKETGGEQVPWQEGVVLGDFYFRENEKPKPIVQAPVKQEVEVRNVRVRKDTSELQRTYWDSISNSNDPAEYQAYLNEFPDGVFAGLAELRIQEKLVVEGNIPEQASPPPVVQSQDRPASPAETKPQVEPPTLLKTKNQAQASTSLVVQPRETPLPPVDNKPPPEPTLQIAKLQQASSSLSVAESPEKLSPWFGREMKNTLDSETLPDIPGLLKRCEAFVQSKQLTSGGSGTAWDCYHEVLKFSPDNSVALSGLTGIEETYVRWIRKEIEAKDVHLAKLFLSRLRVINAEREEVAELAADVAMLESDLAKPLIPGAAPVPGTAQKTKEGAGEILETEPVSQAALQRIISDIQMAIYANWILPRNFTPDMEAVVRVTIRLSGDVTSASVVNSSGNSLFDRSTKIAVLKASPLPVQNKPEYYPYIREFDFRFRSMDASARKSADIQLATPKNNKKQPGSPSIVEVQQGKKPAQEKKVAHIETRPSKPEPIVNDNKTTLLFFPLNQNGKPVKDHELVRRITRNFGRSGEFHIHKETAIEAALITPDYLRQKKASFYITMQLDTVCCVSPELKIQLHDVKNQSKRLAYIYKFDKNHVRSLSNQLSDTLYKEITGKGADFSTELIYIIAKGSERHVVLSSLDGERRNTLLVTNKTITDLRWTVDGKNITYVSGGSGNRITQKIYTGERGSISEKDWSKLNTTASSTSANGMFDIPDLPPVAKITIDEARSKKKGAYSIQLPDRSRIVSVIWSPIKNF